MRRGIRVRTCALGCASLLLAAAGVRAERWEVVEGRLTDAATGASRPLTGSLEGSLFEPDPPDGPDPTVLMLDDFVLSAGALALTPAVPIEHAGLQPAAWVRIAEALHVQGDAVSFFNLLSGGELVAADARMVTFRFHELRGQGRALGRLGDGVLPRRLELTGTLYEVDQSFELPRSMCQQPPPSPGGGAVISSGDAIIEFQRFDLQPQELVEFRPPTNSGAVLNRVMGGRASQIDGQLISGGAVYLANPAGVVLHSQLSPITSPIVVAISTPAPAAPTLEELGMRAPDGAEVSFDAAGVLGVYTAGDLFVEGSFPEIPGLTRVRLVAEGAIVVAASGSLRVPAGVSLELDAGRIEISGPIGGGDPTPAPGEPFPGDLYPMPLPRFCTGLRPIHPAAKRAIGSFSLVASAARQVAVDVAPGDPRNRVSPGSRQVLAVALLGSSELDVRDVDPGSLRLGAGEAEPLALRRQPLALRLRANRDGYLDLVAIFSVREAEVAFGDDSLCLVAETRAGELLEGCDAIETRLVRPR